MKTIVLAPFSNSAVRDWPAPRYGQLVDLILQDPDARVVLVGSASQWLAANEIIRRHPAERAVNTCGYIAWAQVLAQLRAADCVVANNSGLAHISATLGCRTLCVFGASHSPYEWMPRGPAVTVMTKRVECAPCGLDHDAGCPYGVRCLWEVGAEQVYVELTSMMASTPALAV